MALALALVPAASAAAKPRKLVLGTAEPGLVQDDEERRNTSFDRAELAGVGLVRLNAFWFGVAPKRPANPRDPEDPAYDFEELDAAVRTARERGLQVMITMHRAPSWAEGPNPEKRGPPLDDRGTWRPNVKAFGNYVTAVAKRYSGEHPDPLNPAEDLPRVRRYQAWNEPNLYSFLSPQYNRQGEMVAPAYFRRLLNRGYRALKGVDPSNRVIAGGTQPGGTNNDTRIAAETFWRRLFCLRKDLSKRPCKRRLRFDVFDHHPINKLSPPRVVPEGSLVIGNFHVLRRLLRAAERQGTIRPRKTRRPIYATEVYWETNPPDEKVGFAPDIAAAYLQEALYLLWKKGASKVFNFFLTDPALTEPGLFSNVQGGLFFSDGTAKPSLTAYRFPLVSDVVKGKTMVWGRSPVAGSVVIERRRGGDWTRVRARDVEAGEHFYLRLGLRDGDEIRAGIGLDRSLVWEHRPDSE